MTFKDGYLNPYPDQGRELSISREQNWRTPMKINGQCSCGEVNYELSKEPMFVHACHCSLCKKQTGSAFIAHAFIENAHFHLLSGTLRSVLVRLAAVTLMRSIAVNRVALPSLVTTRDKENGGSLKSGRYRIQISSRRVSIYILNRKFPGSRFQKMFLRLKKATISKPFGHLKGIHAS